MCWTAASCNLCLQKYFVLLIFYNQTNAGTCIIRDVTKFHLRWDFVLMFCWNNYSDYHHH